GHPVFSNIVVFFADDFGFLLLGGLLVYLFTHKDRQKGVRDVVVVITAALVAWGLAHLIKYLYPHARPTMLPETHALLSDNDSSFPSGHATFFSALATALYFYHKRLGLFYALGALLIGVARVVAGIHWPLDILAGYILGGAIGFVVYHTYQRFESTVRKYIEKTALLR
ncbi:MAG: phosphatase PAP2 family protein, partial [Candidatus Yonathbacteria bacterium]|nr:phosphatase PAP2 family protein [Candidatus Yonathbacteria bacterium]